MSTGRVDGAVQSAKHLSTPKDEKQAAMKLRPTPCGAKAERINGSVSAHTQLGLAVAGHASPGDYTHTHTHTHTFGQGGSEGSEQKGQPYEESPRR